MLSLYLRTVIASLFLLCFFFPNQGHAASEIIFVKLGGSIITDKTLPYTIRPSQISQLAEELAQIIQANPHLKFIIGHGSGSFGHASAIENHYDKEKGFPSVTHGAKVCQAARALHTVILAELIKAGIPAFSIPPSATATLGFKSKRLINMDVHQVQNILNNGGIPVVYGDVVPFGDAKGTGIASTEEIFSYLAEYFKPSKIILLGEAKGVYKTHAQINNGAPVLPVITPETWGSILSSVTLAKGYDVTGGMRKKVEHMIHLAKAHPAIKIYIASGLTKGILESLVVPEPANFVGTVIYSNPSKKP